MYQIYCVKNYELVCQTYIIVVQSMSKTRIRFLKIAPYSKVYVIKIIFKRKIASHLIHFIVLGKPNEFVGVFLIKQIFF